MRQLPLEVRPPGRVGMVDGRSGGEIDVRGEGARGGGWETSVRKGPFFYSWEPCRIYLSPLATSWPVPPFEPSVLSEGLSTS